MILPNTPLYQSKTDAEFRIRMIDHIKKHYGDVMGSELNLLDLPNGLEILQAKVQQRLYDVSNGAINLIPEERLTDKIAA